MASNQCLWIPLESDCTSIPSGPKGDAKTHQSTPKDVKHFQGIPINACVFHRIMIPIQFRWGPKRIPLDANQFQLNSINSHGIESIPVEPIGNGCQVNSNGGQREWQPNSINPKGFRTIPMGSNACLGPRWKLIPVQCQWCPK